MDPVSENQVEIDSEQHFDWAQSWKASLPIKITSIVLWGIALIGFAIAVIILWDREQILEEQFHGNADRIAYEVTNYSYTNKHTDEELRGYILPFLQQHDFQALKITLLDRIIEIGQYQSDSKTILRDTPYIVTLPKQNIIVQQAILTFYHTDWSEILRTQQKTLLWLIVAICLLFGLFLTWIMHKVVTQPFESLVNATLSVADGKLDTRLDTGRPDEFGQLAKFFNEMLDHINEQQEQLKVALGNAHESTKAKSVFLANMSHELRTPLNAVIGYTELLIDDAEDLSQEEFIPDLKKILSAGKHLLGLINDILDLSKIEAGKMDLFLEEFE
ncbi:MAG: HAMP domain-containing protein, partial [Methylococcales bacterium]|nr:HAMP domain-containing protein [Methylococcales bacterium]